MAAWSTPIKSSDGKTLGALGVFQHDIGLPDAPGDLVRGHRVDDLPLGPGPVPQRVAVVAGVARPGAVLQRPGVIRAGGGFLYEKLGWGAALLNEKDQVTLMDRYHQEEIKLNTWWIDILGAGSWKPFISRWVKRMWFPLSMCRI